MPFNIEPKAGPDITKPSVASVISTADARARAIAALTATPSTAQEHPVRNPSQVSPEEMTAVKASSQAPQDINSDTTEGLSTEETVEAAPEVAPKAPLSDKYAALARRERELRNQIRQFKQQQEAFKAEQAQKPTFDDSKYIPVDRLQQDLLGTLNEKGFSYDKIVEQALSQQTVDPVVRQQLQRMEQQIKAQEEANRKLQASIEEQSQTQRQQAVAQIEMEASSLVKNDPNFEAIRASGKGAVKQVVQLIERTFDQDGILLTVEEAAQAVEDHLVEEATKLTRIGKIQQRLAANAKTAQKPVQTTGQSPQASKTLTNTMSTARPLSARERALLAFKGELK